MVLATERKEWRCIFQVSFSGSQLGLGPREAGIYVLPLIILADIFQTSPADTVLTRAKGWAVSPGIPVSKDSCPGGEPGFPGELLAQELELQDRLHCGRALMSPTPPL